MATITRNQTWLINKLREENAYRMEFDPDAGSEHARNPEAFIAAQHAGRAAFQANIEGISSEEASKIIAALKAW